MQIPFICLLTKHCRSQKSAVREIPPHSITVPDKTVPTLATGDLLALAQESYHHFVSGLAPPVKAEKKSKKVSIKPPLKPPKQANSKGKAKKKPTNGRKLTKGKTASKPKAPPSDFRTFNSVMFNVVPGRTFASRSQAVSKV